MLRPNHICCPPPPPSITPTLTRTPQTLDGGFPELRRTLWQSAAAVQAAVQALTPQAGRVPARPPLLALHAALAVAAAAGAGQGL